MKAPIRPLLLPLALFGGAICLFLTNEHGDAAPTPGLLVGVAKIDITPDEPVRMSGYGSRTEPATDVFMPLHAKALAISDPAENAIVSVIVTVDSIGVPGWMTEELSGRLEKKAGVKRENLVVSSSHTHCSPQIEGTLPFMFMEPMKPEEQEASKRYTRALLDNLEKVALEAVNGRQPADLAWGRGEVDFAVNRRAFKAGNWKGVGVDPLAPVDHSLPMIRANDRDGNLRAVLVNYACHCTTLQFNQIHPDWSGTAQAAIEERHPGAIALVSIGCGADQNPNPRGEIAHADAYGKAIAVEVDRLLKAELKPLTAAPAGEIEHINLAFDPPPVEEWRKRLEKGGDRNALYMQHFMDKLERGEKIPDSLSYPVQTWTLGNDLAMIFLAGEVVIDYTLRFQQMLDPDRLWVTAYANDVPCYIASKRLYGEGGYEVDGSMPYYGKPSRLAIDTEERIAAEVNEQIPVQFRAREKAAAVVE